MNSVCAAKDGHRRSLFTPLMWGSVCLALAALAGVLHMQGVIGRSGALIMLVVACAGLEIAIIGAANRMARAKGNASSALRRYNWRIGIGAVVWIVAIALSAWVHRAVPVSTLVTVLLALCPVAPIFWTIWATGRYLREETDEYQRHRRVNELLGGLAAVLGAGWFWGYFEAFGLLPHVPGWFVVPVWCVGMVLTSLWLGMRAR